MSENVFDIFRSDPKPVVLNAVSESVYHSDRQFISKHALDIFHDCPEKFAMWQNGELPEKDDANLRFGSAFHCAVLEGIDDFVERFIEQPPDIKVKRGKTWADFLNANKSKEILTHAEMLKIESMDTALHRHEKACALLFDTDGNNEQTVLFSIDDFNCKARVDRVIPSAGLILDLKTCVSAHPDAITRAIINYRYHVQGAFYVDAMKIATGEDYDFAIVAIEKEPPFAVGVYVLDDKWIEIGKKIYTQDLADLKEAIEKNEFKGYGTESDILTVPEWYLRKEQSL